MHLGREAERRQRMVGYSALMIATFDVLVFHDVAFEEVVDGVVLNHVIKVSLACR